jgi:hypothetical protein
MRLPLRPVTIWQHASPWLALSLVPLRALARPFALVSTILPHSKHLHDDTKQSDLALEEEPKDSPTNSRSESAPQNVSADSKTAPKDDSLNTRQDDVQTTAVGKRRERREWTSDAKRAASLANLEKAHE